MTVRRSLILLALLIAVPVVIGLIASSQISETTGESEPFTIPEGLPDFAAGGSPFAAFETASNISALGTIEADEVAELSFQVAGKVAVIPVEVGDYVEAGTVIAQLDYESAEITYAQAVLNLERAQASLRELFEPISESEVRAAEASIASAQASYSSIANAVTEKDIQAAELRYQQALISYNAEVQARTQMSGTEEEIALQEAAIGAASFDLEIARLQLEDLQTPDSASLWSASARIEQARLQLESVLEGPTTEEINSAELAVQRAEAQLIEAQNAMKRTQLITLISGYVMAVHVDVADSVSAGTVVMEISDLSQLWLIVPVQELDVDQVEVGMSATIVLDALPNEPITAQVEQIALLGVETDDIVNYDVRLRLNNTDARIRVGMTGEASIAVSGEA